MNYAFYVLGGLISPRYMKILFNIHYGVAQGEVLYLNLQHADGTTSPLRMNHAGDGLWQYELRLDGARQKYQDYYYSVVCDNEVVRAEWTTQAHRIDIGRTGLDCYTLWDTWIEIPHDSYLYSSAFTECVNRREEHNVHRVDNHTSLRLKVRAPQLRGYERLVVSGAHPMLGEWNLDRAVPCVEQAPNEWVCDINAEYLADQDLEYKFVAVSQRDALWETDDNRHIQIGRMHRGETVEYELSQAFFRIWNVKKAGTLIPVFSLRTEGSFGVGDFGDLKRMIDWVEYTGQRLLQVLPINDTTMQRTWHDSYPYSCISVLALHPLYADLRQLPPLKDMGKAAEFEALRRELNALREIDYERVIMAKEEYLHLIFAQERTAVFASEEYQRWFAEEERWLVPYAQYSCLRDEYGTADFTQWPDHNTWDETERNTLTNPRCKAYKSASYYYFVQFVLAKQMRAAHEYARHKRVILKGDIPIGVHPLSCDVWQEPRYFNRQYQTGAPPDDFSINGQNWGFPTYNWEEMLKDGCQWWVRRFQNMQKYFDAYRIDHVLGFFRIWEIPQHAVHGLLGQFQPSLGLTPAEISAYGLPFHVEKFSEPYIIKEIIEDVFKDKAAYVRDTFLIPLTGGRYRLRPEVDTQRKVEKYFASLENGVGEGNPDAAFLVQNAETLRDGLYTLLSNILFLPDHRKPGLYHPRIAAQHSYTYKILLTEQEQCNFNRLYDDYFYKRNTLYWQREAMKKLPRLVEATRMLVCAEDLGMIPQCVPTVMADLRILSLEVQSMPKEYGVRFGNPERYPYRSVCIIDSHDMAPLRQWWDEDEIRAQEYYSQMLGRRDNAPHPLPCWLARDIISRNLLAESMLCVMSLQDWLAISENLRNPDPNAERINIPANPHHYWRYRMHVTIDEMMSNHRFCDDVAEMIRQTGR